jgi:hypothetical protein
MCHFFNVISKKVIDVIELDELRKEIKSDYVPARDVLPSIVL